MISVVRTVFCAITLSAAALQQIGAQVIQGVVQDTAARQPVSGAVLLLLDSAGNTVRRDITDQTGHYRIGATPEMRRMRLLRIGFRPRELALPATNGGTVDFNVSMTALPTMLEAMQVTSGRNCSRRDDRITALSLLEQARAGLLATVVAREAKPADMVRLRYTRLNEPDADGRVRQRVRVDSSSDLKASFQAVRSAADFVKSGFLDTTRGADILYGPDAETLLDNAFSDGYCFELRKHDSKRPNSVGLGFVPAHTEKGRIDIDGTVWIDTVARRLQQIQFDYVGFDRGLQPLHLGGDIRFREVGNGVVLIDRWSLRIPSAVPETLTVGRTAGVIRQLVVQESGGALATAHWPDGFTWTAPLASANVRVVDQDGKPLSGSAVVIDDAEYGALTDESGVAVLRRMLPGTYEGTATDPGLAEIGVRLTAPVKFVVKNEESVNVTVKAPSPAEYVQDACKQEWAELPVDRNGGWFVARVVDLDNRPIKLAQWRALRSVDGQWVPIKSAQGTTSTAGMLEYCGGDAHVGDEVRLESRWSLDDPWHPVTFKLNSHVTPVLLRVPLRDGSE